MKKKPVYTKRFALMMSPVMRKRLRQVANKMKEHEAEVVRRAINKFIIGK